MAEKNCMKVKKMSDDSDFIKKDSNMVKMKPFSEVTKFHGHVCPGSAIGYKAAEAGLNELESVRASDEEIVTIVENDSCAVDAIQVLIGSTFGKGNLLFQDHGKQVYTFMLRSTGEAVRVSLMDSFSVDSLAPKLGRLRAKVNSGIANEQEKTDLKLMVVDVADEILKIPYKDMFRIEHLKVTIPEKARMFRSIKCSDCGEMVSENRSRIKDGKIVCKPCFGDD